MTSLNVIFFPSGRHQLMFLESFMVSVPRGLQKSNLHNITFVLNDVSQDLLSVQYLVALTCFTSATRLA